jgi:membrane protease YdiL (CAAX protease family)
MLWLEFIAIFIATPIFFALFSDFSPVFILVFFAALFSYYLYKDRHFANEQFFRLAGLMKELPRMLGFYAVISASLLLYTAVIYPESLFFCIRNNFHLWCLIMIVYPLFSVFPQEVIYRGFFMRRYACLFRSDTTVIHLSAAAFSFAHIIYFHPVSVILTFGGGYLFSLTYRRTGSLLIASIEHALYGCTLFSIGLGRFFYAGFDKLMQ